MYIFVLATILMIDCDYELIRPNCHNFDPGSKIMSGKWQANGNYF